MDTEKPAPQEETMERLKLMTRQEISQFSGPIPHPDIMRGYEEVLPGSADRILSLAEKEAEHRRALENKSMNADSRDSLMGIICATIISIGALIAGSVIVWNSSDAGGAIAGTLFGVSGISGVIIAMIKRTKR